MTEDPINKQIKQSLDAQADSIDRQTQVKLNELRHAAIKHPQTNQFNRFQWSLVGIAATTVMVISLMLILPKQQTDHIDDSFMFEDLELLANEADTDFYQDIDFLSWLDENQWLESDI
ncbi:hypothetical protein [Marinicella litoralis]|uniref:DUF3619 family protein n=1 Tax=Marinicella litoralis TaxID=644220 RepID=A0A4R6XWA3_9GAMM|nr:hypothetical protein [Marinicella litoralis]TDR20768.1 hypothetical protein C8D91_1746 [Marinicella litoralis]